MIKSLFLTLFISLLVLEAKAFAEYRVYQYYIRSKVQNINPPKAELVTSTLDPASYIQYNGGKSSIEVNLMRSWMCMGDTSKKSPCTMEEETKGEIQ